MAQTSLGLVTFLLSGLPPQCCDSGYPRFIKLSFIVLVSNVGADQIYCGLENIRCWGLYSTDVDDINWVLQKALGSGVSDEARRKSLHV